MTDLTPMVTATIDYEDWLRRRVDVVEADLHLKHRQMASSLFTFLRDILPVGFALDGDLPRSRRDSASVGGWRPACGKFWYLARQGREAGLGRQ